MSGPNKQELPSAQAIRKSLDNHVDTTTKEIKPTRRHFLGSLLGLTLTGAGVYLTRKYPPLNEQTTNSEIVKKIAPSQNELAKQQVGLLIEPNKNSSTSVTGWKVSGKMEPENLNLEKTVNPILVPETKRFIDKKNDQPAIDYGIYFSVVPNIIDPQNNEKLIHMAIVVKSENRPDNQPVFEDLYLKNKSVLTLTNPKSGLSKKYQATITPSDNPLVQLVPLTD